MKKCRNADHINDLQGFRPQVGKYTWKVDKCDYKQTIPEVLTVLEP